MDKIIKELQSFLSPDWITALTALTGTIVALLQFRRQINDHINDNELSKSPNFYFTAPRECSRFGASYCSYSGSFMPLIINDCNGEEAFYLFNIVNSGIFAASNVRIAVLSEYEAGNDIFSIPDKRWIKFDYLSGTPTAYSETQAGDLVPIYIHADEIKIKKKDSKIYVALEYESSYSKTLYRIAYEWCIGETHDDEQSYKNGTQVQNSIIRKNFGRSIFFREVRTIGVSSSSLKIRSKIRRHILSMKNESIDKLTLISWVNRIK